MAARPGTARVLPAAGLTSAEAAARLGQHGPNRLGAERRPRYARIAGRQLVDPLVALLVAAAAVSLALGERIEAVAIAAIVVLNGALGFAQEAGAERAMHALRAAFRQRARVVRDGATVEIPAEEVVPGDALVLAAGDRVAADGLLLEASGLEVDESALTGESAPVAKGTEPPADGASFAEQTASVFAGTGVTRGRALAEVQATGPATELGRIAALTEGARRPPTPMQRRIGGLSRVLALAGVVLTVSLAAAMLAQGATLHEAFLVGASVAVAAVPEGLAATVTIALALGAREMAKRGAIVRRLDAVETLGSVTGICTDKTGTLTQNRLRVAATAPVEDTERRDVLTAALLASAIDAGDGAVADPLERALREAAAADGVAPGPLLATRDALAEFPFDPQRRRMTVVYEERDARFAYAKGAPETLLAFCEPGDDTERLTGLAQAWAEEGLRVIAVAARRLPDGVALEPGAVERELTPLGLVAFDDPLRPAAADSVAEARSAGVSVRMLTGDHPATARTIGRTLGLDEDAVHARVTPADKLELVRRLQAGGETIAVTGDGVNDAPALRAAEVGVAMGLSGTEAAREAADLVLTNDDFATIVAAMREGRRIAANVRKFTAFLLSANLGEVLLFAIAILGGLGVPMTVVMVLVVNVITDGLPAVALALDPASPESMSSGPPRRDRLLTRAEWLGVGGGGALVGLAALTSYLVVDAQGSGGQTAAFVTVAVAELVLVFSFRSWTEPSWRGARNPQLFGAVALSLPIVLAGVYLPFLHEPLGTVALGGSELAVALLLALVPAAGVEAVKSVLRRR